MADTFDILLFRNKNAEGQQIRDFTECEYGEFQLNKSLICCNIDHIAMILRYECKPNEVWFLESTSKNGVTVKKWSDIKGSLGTEFNVAIRHLNWARPESSLPIIEQFLKETDGSAFDSFDVTQTRKKTITNQPK